jgi:hypothetical protein
MLAFKLLHILSMFAAVTLLIGEQFVLSRAIWRRDVRALATFHRLIGVRPVIGASLFMAGIVFGLLTAATGGLDFFAGWLIAAYVLVAAILAFNASPWVQQMPRLGARAVEAEAGERPIDEVVQGMAASHAGLLFAVNVTLFVALIADMVLKPF